MMIAYDENGYLVVGPLRLRHQPKESLIVKGFQCSGDHIIEYGTIERRVSNNPKLDIEDNVFAVRKYNLCG